MKAKFYILGFASALLIIAVLSGSYLLGKNTKKSSSTLTPTPTPIFGINNQPNTRVSPTPTPAALSTREAVIQAVENKNYNSLLDYMSVVIPVRIEGTDCCGNKTGSGAIESMDYLEEADNPWSWDADSKISLELESLYPEHYSNSIIGISKNDYLVAIQLDENDNITKISMTNDYTLLLP